MFNRNKLATLRTELDGQRALVEHYRKEEIENRHLFCRFRMYIYNKDKVFPSRGFDMRDDIKWYLDAWDEKIKNQDKKDALREEIRSVLSEEKIRRTAEKSIPKE